MFFYKTVKSRQREPILSTDSSTSYNINQILYALKQVDRTTPLTHKNYIGKQAGKLLENKPNNPDVLYCCGLVAMINQNFLSAWTFLRSAIAYSPNHELALSSLDSSNFSDLPKSEVREIIEQAKYHMPTASNQLYARAAELIAQGKFEAADPYFLNAISLAYPFVASLQPISDAIISTRSLADKIGEDKFYEKLNHQLVKGVSRSDRYYPAEYAPLPRHQQIADIVLEIIRKKAPETASVVEFGSADGVILKKIMEMAVDESLPIPTLFGLEARAYALEYGREHLPDVKFLYADETSFEKNDLALPNQFTLFLASSVFVNNTPNTLNAALTYLSERSEKLLIAEDIVFLEGDEAFCRDHPEQTWFHIVHPYRKALLSAGFEIRDVHAVSQLDATVNGIIVADNLSLQ